MRFYTPAVWPSIPSLGRGSRSFGGLWGWRSCRGLGICSVKLRFGRWMCLGSCCEVRRAGTIVHQLSCGSSIHDLALHSFDCELVARISSAHMSIPTLFPSILIGLYVFSRESPISSSTNSFGYFQAPTIAPGNGTPLPSVPPSSRLICTTRRIRRRYKPNNRNPPPNAVPNRGKPTPAPFIATHLQNLRRQRPDLLK